MTPALPVTVLGGYLGAGKTTLVNRVLRQAGGLRIAVLVNEFGALPIDADLIEARDASLISIAGGCICCSFGSDLGAALRRLLRMEPRPERILVEASGVAMPGAIAQNVALLGELRVAGICVLADCGQIRAQAHDAYIGDTIARQIGEADIVVLTKVDLAPDPVREEARAWLDRSWPLTPVIPAVAGDLPNSIVLGEYPGRPRPRGSGGHADADFASVVLNPAGPCDLAQLAQALRDPGLGVSRAKGYLDDVSGRRGLLQLAGAFVEVSFPERTGAAGLVCIGPRETFDAKGVEALAQSLPNAGQALTPARA